MTRAVRTTYLKSLDESKSPKHIDIQLGDEDLIGTTVVINTVTESNTIPFKVEQATNKAILEAAVKANPEVQRKLDSAKWLQKANELGLKGIYEIKGDHLAYCFAQPGDKRPASFDVAKGSGYTLVRLKRFTTGEEKIEKQLLDANTKVQKDEVGWIMGISIVNAPNADELLSAATDLKKLNRVSVTESSISSAGFQHLAKMPGLYSLSVKAESHPITGIEALADLPKLRDVSLRGSQVNDGVLRAASQLKQLYRLNLYRASASSDAVEKLVVTLPSLTRFDVNGANLDSSAWNAIADMQHLQMLSAARSNITDKDLAGLGRLKQLTGLLIQNTAASDRGFAELASLSKLNFLRIDGTLVTDESLKLIARSFPNLRTLYMGNLGVGITDEGLLALGQHPALNYIHVSKGKFSQQAIEILRKVRKELRVIE